jgi:hypothetical protein
MVSPSSPEMVNLTPSLYRPGGIRSAIQGIVPYSIMSSAEAFYLQVSGGQLARAGVSDGGFGPVAEDPGGRCCHAVEVVDVLLGEPPVSRVRVEITAGGPGALLAITSEGQDAGDLSG